MSLLRSIRSRLIENEQTTKYLKYAIGEILLIIIGILVAVGINNQVSHSKDLDKEITYLKNLQLDFESDIRVFTNGYIDRFEDKIAGLELAKQYAIGNYEVVDTIQFFNRIGRGGAGSRGNNLGSNATFDDLLSTGNLILIRNNELKRSIQEYYRNREFMHIYANNLRTQYANFTNSVRPYNPSDPDAAYFIPTGRLESKLQTPEFLDQVNQELTFGHSIYRYMSRQTQDARDLIDEINKELEK